MAVSADGGTLFASEHLERRVLAFDIAGDGTLSNARCSCASMTWCRPIPPLVGGRRRPRHRQPGNVYVAEYGSGRVIVVDRDAAHIATIDVPEKYVTAPALIDGERRIFITAPVSLFDPAAPGKVYVVENPAYRTD